MLLSSLLLQGCIGVNSWPEAMDKSSNPRYALQVSIACCLILLNPNLVSLPPMLSQPVQILFPLNLSFSMQIITSLGKWDKFTYEGTKAIQLNYAKAMFGEIGRLGISGTGLRTFNVDNSAKGAGVKSRIWFKDNNDCMAFQAAADTSAEVQGFLPVADFGVVDLRMITKNKCHKWKVRKYPDLIQLLIILI